MTLRLTAKTLKLSIAVISVLLVVVGLLRAEVVLTSSSHQRTGLQARPMTDREIETLSRLPQWERGFLRRDLMAPHVRRLPAVVPPGGVAQAEPGTSAVWLYLQPATPSTADLTATQADAVEQAEVGGDIVSTTFGLGTMASNIVPPGQTSPAPGGDAVLNTPVWVVTTQAAQPYANPWCGCGPVEYTEYVTVESATTGDFLDGFSA